MSILLAHKNLASLWTKHNPTLSNFMVIQEQIAGATLTETIFPNLAVCESRICREGKEKVSGSDCLHSNSYFLPSLIQRFVDPLHTLHSQLQMFQFQILYTRHLCLSNRSRIWNRYIKLNHDCVSKNGYGYWIRIVRISGRWWGLTSTNLKYGVWSRVGMNADVHGKAS